MNKLIRSYDKLKGKYNQFAAKCLSEKQKRESGLILVAPDLILPTENNGNENEEVKEENKDKKIQSKNQVRMGGRLGAKMEKAERKD